MPLSVREHQALTVADALARRNRGRIHVLELTGYTEPRLHQVVGALLDDPAALAERPAVVARLRRLRERSRAARKGAA